MGGRGPALGLGLHEIRMSESAARHFFTGLALCMTKVCTGVGEAKSYIVVQSNSDNIYQIVSHDVHTILICVATSVPGRSSLDENPVLWTPVFVRHT